MKLQSLGKLVEIKTGKLDANAAVENGQYPFFTCAKKESRIDKFSFDCEAILIAGNGDLNVKRYKGKFDAYQRTYVLSIKSPTDVHFEYLYYFLEGYVEKLREMSIGGVIKYIKLGMLTEAKIPLPPPETQKKIASVLEKADQLRKDCQQMEQELNSLAQSVFIDMFGDPVTNPKGWDFSELKSFIVNLRNGVSPSKDGEVESKVLTLSAITQGNFNETHCKVGLFNSPPDESKKIKKNDFLICRGNGNKNLVGRGVYPTDSRDDLVFPDTVIGVTLDLKRLDIRYMNTLWSNTFLRDHIESGARTTNGTYKINQKVISSAPIMCPPVELQRHFGDTIESVNKLIAQNQNQLREFDDNFNVLMQKAFKGELSL